VRRKRDIFQSFARTIGDQSTDSRRDAGERSDGLCLVVMRAKIWSS
jgi:hypothetical protein